MLGALGTFAQELNCRVFVNASEITSVDKEVFDNMQKAMREFMSNRVWTNHVFTEQERIEANIQVKITKASSSGAFVGSFQIQASRPVYGTTHKTILLNHIEKDIKFVYDQFSALEYDDNAYTSELTSILAFYAYFIIGLDYDTFKMRGGDEFFTKAERIVNNAQGTSGSGWDKIDKNSRASLLNDISSAGFIGFRESLYIYHRKGLDVMAFKIEDGRRQVLEAMLKMQKVHKNRPSSYLFDIFFNAKKKELIEMFKEGKADEKQTIVELLKKMNSANAADYDAINK